MAGRTQGDRILDLERFAAATEEQVKNGADQTAALDAAHTETARILGQLQRDYEKEIALLKREIEELKRDRERWAQRVWMIVAPLIAATIGVAVGMKK